MYAPEQSGMAFLIMRLLMTFVLKDRHAFKPEALSSRLETWLPAGSAAPRGAISGDESPMEDKESLRSELS